MSDLTRRQFLKATGAAAIGAALFGAGCAGAPGTAQTPPPRRPESTTGSPGAERTHELRPDIAYLAAAKNANPAKATALAIAAVGGMERFVRRGDDVIIKPNVCTDYHPAEYAATTNPTVVATLVALCRKAGAGRVRVMDNPFGGSPESAYHTSGIGPAVEQAGGTMEVMSPVKYATYTIPQGRDISKWPVYRDVMEADVLINVPIGKTHSLSRLTLGGKNLLGVVLDPVEFHGNIGQRVADLISLVRPTLTVVDAVRILTANGPTGGDLSDVRRTNTVIASHDVVAADAYAATLFGRRGAEIPYVRAAAAMDLGRLDLGNLEVKEIGV